MINVCGLWKNETKDGKKYISGKLCNIKILIFPNEKKVLGSNSPDFTLCIADDKTDTKDKKVENPFI